MRGARRAAVAGGEARLRNGEMARGHDEHECRRASRGVHLSRPHAAAICAEGARTARVRAGGSRL